MNLDQDVRAMLRERADGVVAAPVVPDGTVRRVRVRKALWTGGVALGVAAIAVAGAFARSAMWTDAAPVPPADETEQEIQQMRNGQIITSANAGQEWHAFDQNAGLFYYFKYWTERAFVFDQDGPVAKFDCPPSVDCEFATAFGPGPEELTVPGDQSVQVIGFDGKVRHTLEISPDSPVFIDEAPITDLAWSPDGNRLAISNEPDCGYGSDACEGKVWIVERDGGEPQLVFTERAPADLAWSPDGRSLTLLVSSDVVEFDDIAHDGVWPRLVALRLQPGQPVRAETLHVYDDVGLPAWNDVPDGWRFYFASAWSPDGSRIAVTSKGGVSEISAEDGHLLARHSDESLDCETSGANARRGCGLLAWLPEH